jgi:hypothetical protein
MAPAVVLGMRCIAVILCLAGPAAAQESLSGRTHSFVAPSGETVARGETTLQVHALAAWNQVLYGATDRLELSIAAPAFPLVATFGARLALTPRESRARLIVGGGVLVTLPITADAGDEAGAAGWVSVTAAVTGERWNLHASAYAFGADDASLHVLTAGALWRTGSKAALFLDVGELSVPGFTSVDDCSGCSGGGGDRLRGVGVGLKLLGDKVDADVGLVVPIFTDRAYLIPMLSLTAHR